MRNPSKEEAICAWLCEVAGLDPNKIPRDALTIRHCGDGSVAVEWWEVKYSGPYRITVSSEATPPPFEMIYGDIVTEKVDG